MPAVKAIRKTDGASVKKTAKTAGKPKKTAKKVTLDDVWAAIAEVAEAHRETEKGLQELKGVHKETEKSLKETSRIVGDLGNRFGDIAEQMLVPDLVDKFEHFGFSFGKLSHNIRWKKKDHSFSMELDALLENGGQAMVVEVKARLDKADIDEQISRMEKVRRFADLEGDTRQFLCAMAALSAPSRVIEYASSKGFYLIMPSGEDVKITKPVSGPAVW
jgi:hypothetical protein